MAKANGNPARPVGVVLHCRLSLPALSCGQASDRQLARIGRCGIPPILPAAICVRGYCQAMSRVIRLLRNAAA
jgi:hypothetical protein